MITFVIVHVSGTVYAWF